MKKQVQCYHGKTGYLIKKFDSVNQASRWLKKPEQATLISRAIRKKIRYHGYYWSYDNKDNYYELSLTQKEKPDIFYYDIETTNFGADFGEILMFAYKWEGMDDVEIVSILDYPEMLSKPVEQRDKFIVRKLIDSINKADIVVAHYGSKFDNKFLQARGLFHGYNIADIRWNKVFDTCITARKNIRLGSNRLKNLAQFFGCDNQKTEMSKHTWRRCNDYDPSALEEMEEYCKNDVRALYDIAQKLRPLAKHLPNLQNLVGADFCCSDCGGELKQDGFWETKASTYLRYKCSKCGKWHRGAKPYKRKKMEERVMY